MTTVSPHKSWEGSIYESFISENNGGLCRWFHWCRRVESRVTAVTFPEWRRARVLCKCARSSIIPYSGCRCVEPLPAVGLLRGQQVTLPRAACWIKPPLHSISLGHKFIFQTCCSASAGSSALLISLPSTVLIQHHLSWPSKLERSRQTAPPSAGPRRQIRFWFSLLGLSVSSL